MLTKKEYFDAIPYETWLIKHKKYIDNALKQLQPYFNYEQFVSDYSNKVSELVIKSILADAIYDNNNDESELENYIARMFCIPYKKVLSYRTEKFWKEKGWTITADDFK